MTSLPSPPIPLPLSHVTTSWGDHIFSSSLSVLSSPYTFFFFFFIFFLVSGGGGPRDLLFPLFSFFSLSKLAITFLLSSVASTLPTLATALAGTPSRRQLSDDRETHPSSPRRPRHNEPSHAHHPCSDKVSHYPTSLSCTRQQPRSRHASAVSYPRKLGASSSWPDDASCRNYERKTILRSGPSISCSVSLQVRIGRAQHRQDNASP